MRYIDESTCEVQLGDRVLDITEPFEPSDAEVIAIGRNLLLVSYLGNHMDPPTTWLPINKCEFVSRKSDDG